MRLFLDNPKLWAVPPVLLLIVLAIPFTSWFGMLAVTVSGISILLFVFTFTKLGFVAAGVVGAISIVAAMVDNSWQPQASKIAMLTRDASLQPVMYNLTTDQDSLVDRTLSACGLHNINRTFAMTIEAWSAINEPGAAGFASWSLKPKLNRGDCLDRAIELAKTSPVYQSKLNAITR